METMEEKQVHKPLALEITFNQKEDLLDLAQNEKYKKFILEEKYKAPYTIYETRTEEGKRARRELRKLLGRDTTPRGINHKEYRINEKNKCNCLVTVRSELDCVVDKEYNYRFLTITEMERLQNVPDGYTNYVSENQRRKMLGNGWTVDVIAHIFSYLK
jgi:site-specific DNA-cytosine methylase